MKIPADAIIAPEKLTQYLLVWQRKKDKSKFLAIAGFTLDNPQDLEAGIRHILETNDAVFEKENEFGQYFPGWRSSYWHKSAYTWGNHKSQSGF